MRFQNYQKLNRAKKNKYNSIRSQVQNRNGTYRLVPMTMLGTDHYYLKGGGILKINCLQKQKSPNKLFVDMEKLSAGRQVLPKKLFAQTTQK